MEKEYVPRIFGEMSPLLRLNRAIIGVCNSTGTIERRRRTVVMRSPGGRHRHQRKGGR